MTDQKNQTRPRVAKVRKPAAKRALKVVEFSKPAEPEKDRIETLISLAEAITQATLVLNTLLAEERGRR